MAEQYALHRDLLITPIIEDGENEQHPKDNVTHVDFRQNRSRQESMQRIREVVTSIWLTEDGFGAISHEPISVHEELDGSLRVRFKEYLRGFNGDEYGIPHPNGLSGLETIKVLDVELKTGSHTIKSRHVHPRNFRYIFPLYEAKKRSLWH